MLLIRREVINIKFPMTNTGKCGCSTFNEWVGKLVALVKRGSPPVLQAGLNVDSAPYRTRCQLHRPREEKQTKYLIIFGSGGVL